MAGEWRTFRIEEIAERVGIGPFGSSIKVETFVPEGIPVISGQHLHNFRLDDTPGYNFISPEHAEQLRNANVQRGDVVFTHAGNIGQVAYIPNTSAFDRYVLSQRQFYLRPDQSKVLPEFLVAYFRSPEGQHKLLANSSQVGVPSIAQPVTYLRSLEIPLPPLPEQRAIAHILGTLDDKIELNRRMSETLEAMARALFKSWFIDFDPVRRNMARKRGRNQSSPPSPLPVGERKGHYRGGYDFAGLVKTARELRKKQTPAEAIFWELVRDRQFLNLKFRRQHQIGDYLADFYCHEYRLVIEFDGGVHSGKKPKDQKRDAWMTARGFDVLRFKNEQLLDDPESVLTAIAHAVEGPPSPSGRGACDEGMTEGPPSPSGRRAGDEDVMEGPPSPSGRRAGDEGVIEGCAFDHLFPNRLVDSELGEIPEGWEVVQLDTVADIQGGKQLPSNECKIRGRYPVFGANGIMGYADRSTHEGFVIAFGRVGANCGSIHWTYEGAWINNNASSVVPRRWPEFILQAMLLTEFEGIQMGSAQPFIQISSLASLRVVRPLDHVLDVFCLLARPVRVRQQAAVNVSRTLAALRDALLPKLIRGEIRVKDAEQFLKERGL